MCKKRECSETVPEEGSAHGKTVAVTPCPLEGVHTEPAYRAPGRECTRYDNQITERYRAQWRECTRETNAMESKSP